MSNYIVLVTGSAVGIGCGVAESHAREGATIIGLDIDAEENAETARLVEAAGGNFHGYQCDIGDRQQVRAVFDDLEGKIDHIDLLVNNAAVFGDTLLTSSDWETQTRAFEMAIGDDPTEIAELFYDGQPRWMAIEPVGFAELDMKFVFCKL